jgi:hypothetical protein
MDNKTLRQVKYIMVRPEAEPRAVQIDAWLGDLYLGQRTYYASSIANAKSEARNRIKRCGSLN